ncbi:MAG: glutathione transport system permease protein [Actinomycetota bacterium]|jgi:peptide/nickel transport system permease protein|nr:glutathione transport system permease protein [Actinomycetota bacterium]
MLAYTIRRLLVSIPVLLVATFLMFVIVAASGDPLDQLKTKNPRPPQATIDLAAHRLRLDQPVLERYWHWITGIVHGDFGPAVQGGGTLDIGSEIGHRALVTVRLVFFAMVLAALLAVVVGVISARKQYTAIDYSFTFTGFLFLAMPTFWFAILLKEAAIWSNNHGWTHLKTIGDRSPSVSGGFLAHVGDSFNHMVLPTITLALISYAAWSRFNRASMLEVLSSDYIRLARAKGITPRRVLIRHALRTALIPFVTVTALDIAAILGGAIITETIFQWRGMGDFLVRSIFAHDPYAILAWLLIAGAAVIIFNLIADLLYGVLDPRIRYE